MTLLELFNTISTFTISGATVSGVVIFLFVLLALLTAFRWQKSNKVDFSDLITYPGNNAVSLTKVIQLLGGIVSSWVVIKLAILGNVDSAIFGLYLAYVGGVEAYSKYLRVKHGPANKGNEKVDEDSPTPKS